MLVKQLHNVLRHVAIAKMRKMLRKPSKRAHKNLKKVLMNMLRALRTVTPRKCRMVSTR